MLDNIWNPELFVPLYLALCYSIFLVMIAGNFDKFAKWKKYVININAGLMFAYLFIQLLPDVFLHNDAPIPKFTYIFLFLGYISFYMAEKHEFALKESRMTRAQDLLMIRRAGFYVVHFITGYLIVYVFSHKAFLSTLILLIPFTMYTIAMVLMYEDLEHWLAKSHNHTWTYAGLIFLGAVAATVTTYILDIPLFYFYAFFAGTLVYLMTTMDNPKQKRGHIVWFIVGILVFAILHTLDMTFG
ncbi:MAG TPA: hypothetical protein VK158_00290 [Acidobacteriota bacterium]|nr:hypothetical protein [Acidobacteriota bacterium]